MSAPSLKTLKKFFPADQAQRLRELMTGTRDPKQYQRVQNWLDQCYNEPSRAELIMAALDEELDGFGTEAIRGRYVDRYHGEIQAEYVNMGDTYDLTILLDHETENFILTSMGDWIEKNEKRRKLA